ncbi:MAG: hypothetical protein MJA28_14765 [Gammaproteobacteria bacterium]|nr:hypothetical protein [Gammaproteobacteria bacterium]
MSLIFGLSLSYPFLIFYGLQNFKAAWLLPILFFMIFTRLLMIGANNTHRVLLLGGTLLMAVLISFSGAELGLKLYPVLISTSFLIVFFSSLYSKQSAIERIARIKEPDLPPKAVNYTRRVTQVWSVFFLINGGIALYLAIYGSTEMWTLYNGLISYLIMAMIFSVEFVVRQKVRQQ